MKKIILSVLLLSCIITTSNSLNVKANTLTDNTKKTNIIELN